MGGVPYGKLLSYNIRLMPSLVGLLLLPLIGAVVIGFMPARFARAVRICAIVTMVAALAWALWLLSVFDPAGNALQLQSQMVWNPRFGSSFALGVDGVALTMLLLTAVLSLVAALASGSIREKQKSYYILLLALQSAVFGVFSAQDWALFYVFWELTLIPLFFLIDRFGGQQRHRAALNFVLYTMGGSVFLLIAMLVLFDALPQHSFAMSVMQQGAQQLSASVQIAIFLGFLIGFGVKLPIFPLHGWLPLAHVEAPAPVSILLSGILLKMGAFGLIRAAAMLPAAIVALQDVLMVLAFINLLYGGLLAWRQHDLKAMIAYSSVSHMGVVLLGIATLNITGLTGAVMQMVAHGLVAGGLFLLIGLLYQRTHTRDVRDYTSLSRDMPRFAVFTVLAFFAAIGLPGTAGFVAELHTLIAAVERWGMLAILLGLGVAVSAGYAIRTIVKLFTGPVHAKTRELPDLHRSEMLAAGLLATLTLWLGFFPGSLLLYIAPALQQFNQIFATLAG